MPQRDGVDGERIGSGVKASQVLGPAAAHHAHQTVGSVLETIQNREVRRELVQQHHNRRRPIRLAFEEQVLIATAADPFHIADAQQRHLDRVAANLGKRNAKVGVAPRAGDRVLRHPATIMMRLVHPLYRPHEMLGVDAPVPRNVVHRPVLEEAIINAASLDHDTSDNPARAGTPPDPAPTPRR